LFGKFVGPFNLLWTVGLFGVMCKDLDFCNAGVGFSLHPGGSRENPDRNAITSNGSKFHQTDTNMQIIPNRKKSSNLKQLFAIFISL
jgi:hypothetical protein